jgi:hypothetical protein
MRILAAALVLFLAGCETFQPAPAPMDAIIAEAVVASRAPLAEQQATLARAQKAFGSGAPADRLRLATLLATLPPPLRDDARAAKLLEPIADGAAAGVGRFAALLSSQIAERQQVTRERERSDKERDKREEALKQQLEALRAIERGILEREEKLRRKQK